MYQNIKIQRNVEVRKFGTYLSDKNNMKKILLLSAGFVAGASTASFVSYGMRVKSLRKEILALLPEEGCTLTRIPVSKEKSVKKLNDILFIVKILTANSFTPVDINLMVDEYYKSGSIEEVFKSTFDPDVDFTDDLDDSDYSDGIYIPEDDADEESDELASEKVSGEYGDKSVTSEMSSDDTEADNAE